MILRFSTFYAVTGKEKKWRILKNPSSGQHSLTDIEIQFSGTSSPARLKRFEKVLYEFDVLRRCPTCRPSPIQAIMAWLGGLEYASVMLA